MRESRAILVASNYMAMEYLRNGFSNVHVLPLCVESGPAPKRRELPAEVTLLFVGRVTDLKGLDLLVRGARRFTNITGRRCRVVVAGTGPALARAEKLAARLRVPLESLGWVDEKGRDELFQQATLLVIPSTWPEPFGLVGLEAARFGLPTVAFAVGGLNEWLRSGINGEFAERPASSDSLADALARATADPTHYSALVEGARREVERFDPPAHLRRLFDVFESLVETAPSLDSASEVQERSEPRAGQGEPQS
jgi:glycosyltransferase involved in cell wall biosynthesis